MSEPKKVLSPEELIEGFKKQLPKRPVYPPINSDDEDLDHSSTESEESDDDSIEDTCAVELEILRKQTEECAKAWAEIGVDDNRKTPEWYIQDNVIPVLSLALSKFAVHKPKDPLSWLSYCLLNLNISHPPKKTNDHLWKPTGVLRDFKFNWDFVFVEKDEQDKNTPSTSGCRRNDEMGTTSRTRTISEQRRLIRSKKEESTSRTRPRQEPEVYDELDNYDDMDDMPPLTSRFRFISEPQNLYKRRHPNY